jgi:hypothetical protein
MEPPDVAAPPHLAEFEATIMADGHPAVVLIDRVLARHLLRYLRDVERRLAVAEEGSFY